MSNNLRAKNKNQLINVIRELEKAVKDKCYDCMGGQKRTDCHITDCSLYKFRPWSKNNKD
jgi:hypothetical protein